jgi:hypothetical protein
MVGASCALLAPFLLRQQMTGSLSSRRSALFDPLSGSSLGLSRLDERGLLAGRYYSRPTKAPNRPPLSFQAEDLVAGGSDRAPKGGTCPPQDNAQVSPSPCICLRKEEGRQGAHDEHIRGDRACSARADLRAALGGEVIRLPSAI